MLQNSDLLISFQNEEQKEIFIKWFDSIGFNNFINNSETDVSCISTLEYGETSIDTEYTNVPNGFIELQ